MGMEFKIGNLFQFIAYITPFLVIFTLILIGFLNYEPLKPLIYIGSVVISTVMAVLVQRTQTNNDDVGRSAMCDIFEFPFSPSTSGYDIPSLSIFFMAFTVLYIVLPMILQGDINYPIMIFMIVLLGADVMNKFTHKCTNMLGVGVSILMGGLFGAGFSMLYYNYIPEYLYISSMNSNKVSCSRKKQKFICVKKQKGKIN